MSVTSPPAIAGGTPIRERPLPYGRHQLDEADVTAVVDALRSGTLTGGAAIADFEQALAARCKVANAVAVANGSVALDISVLALGIQAGDEVITTPLTFVATANAVLRIGATPVFADIGEDRCLDPESVARAVTPRTRAVITVDYSSLPADVPALRAALPRPLPIIVDGAHSLGASLGGRPAGSIADITTLSFHPVEADDHRRRRRVPHRRRRDRRASSQPSQPRDDEHRSGAHRSSLEIRRHHARRQSPHDVVPGRARLIAAAPSR